MTTTWRTIMRRSLTAAARIITAVLTIVALAFGIAWFVMIRMPGTSHAGPLPALSPEEARLAESLRRDVTILATDIGPRNAAHRHGLDRTTAWLEERLLSMGYAPRRETFTRQGATFHNVIAEKRGTTHPDDIVIVGGHYDTFGDVPGANDNGSGVAATLALAERLATARLGPTLRFVLFTNEEPPSSERRGWAATCTRRVAGRAAKTFAPCCRWRPWAGTATSRERRSIRLFCAPSIPSRATS